MESLIADAKFDRNCIKEWINGVENDAAHFIGHEFCAARLIGFISRQHSLGEVSDDAAAQLINDARHLANLATLGHRYVKMVRKPSAELEIMVLTQHKKVRA